MPIFGAIDIQQGEVIIHRAPAANATAFLDFLHVLQEKYHNRLVVLVFDNARIHQAKMVRVFVNEEGNPFHFIFLPPYSPQLNPIERWWKWLKDDAIANVFHKDQADIDQSVTHFADYILKHPDEVLRRLGYTP